MIFLRLPGELRHRDVALHAVAAACRLVGPRPRIGLVDSTTLAHMDLSREFDAQVISAFAEAFNNIAIHAYATRRGDVEIEIDVAPDRITLCLRDNGDSFDPSEVPKPPLDEMAEGGFGMFIIHSFVDEFRYEPGAPNVWRFTKHFESSPEQSKGID